MPLPAVANKISLFCWAVNFQRKMTEINFKRGRNSKILLENVMKQRNDFLILFRRINNNDDDDMV